MIDIPRVALFRPDEREAAAILPLFQREEYSIRAVTSVEEIVELVEDEASRFDCIILPQRLAQGLDGIRFCLQIRADARLTPTPILGIASSKDRGSVRSYYDAGVDIVAHLPIDSDMLLLQIQALARSTRAVHQHIASITSDIALSTPFLDALSASREAIIVFDQKGLVRSFNEGAAVMFGELVLRDHLFSASCAPVLRALRGPHDTVRAVLPRIGGGAVTVDARGRPMSLAAPDGTLTTVGAVLSFVDRSEVDRIEGVLAQSRRAHALAVLASCAAGVAYSFPSSPVASFEYRIKHTPAPCSLGNVMSYLDEVLDSVMDPATHLSCTTEGSLSLGVSAPVAVHLVGALILCASRYGAIPCDVTVQSKVLAENGGIALIATSEMQVPGSALASDTYSLALRGEKLGNDSSTSVLEGVNELQALADSHNISLEFQRMSETGVKMRLVFPMAQAPI